MDTLKLSGTANQSSIMEPKQDDSAKKTEQTMETPPKLLGKRKAIFQTEKLMRNMDMNHEHSFEHIKMQKTDLDKILKLPMRTSSICSETQRDFKPHLTTIQR